MTTIPWTDPIVAEVRQWRAELMQEAGNDVGKLCEMLMKLQEEHGGPIESRETVSLAELQERIRKHRESMQS